MRRDHSGDNGGYLTQHNTKVAPAPATPRQHRPWSPAALVCIGIAARHFPTRKTAQSRHLDEGALSVERGSCHGTETLCCFCILSPQWICFELTTKENLGHKKRKRKGWMVNGHCYSQLSELLKTDASHNFHPQESGHWRETEDQLDLCAEPFNFYFSLKSMCQRVDQHVYLIKWLGHLAY